RRLPGRLFAFFPVRTGKCIEHVRLQVRVTVRHAGMVEVACGIASHSEAFHDGCRANVAAYGEGDDLLLAESLESEGEPGAGSLGGIALAPEIRCQPPADLDASRFRR